VKGKDGYDMFPAPVEYIVDDENAQMLSVMLR
jgi:hypothetical protein